jgi:uncharacterized oligopeptide transporter (OPT) family protein
MFVPSPDFLPQSSSRHSTNDYLQQFVTSNFCFILAIDIFKFSSLFLSSEHVSQESLIAVIVGCVLTVLLLILIIIYAVKAGKCCCCNSANSHSHPNKKDFKNTDLER